MKLCEKTKYFSGLSRSSSDTCAPSRYESFISMECEEGEGEAHEGVHEAGVAQVPRPQQRTAEEPDEIRARPGQVEQRADQQVVEGTVPARGHERAEHRDVEEDDLRVRQLHDEAGQKRTRRPGRFPQCPTASRDAPREPEDVRRPDIAHVDNGRAQRRPQRPATRGHHPERDREPRDKPPPHPQRGAPPVLERAGERIEVGRARRVADRENVGEKRRAGRRRHVRVPPATPWGVPSPDGRSCA